jgi:hypothetical protein
MNWKAFGSGAGIGIITAVIILLPSTLFFRWIPGANVVNFGPAVFGFGLFLAEMAVALILLAFGILSFFRRRWPRAGFALSASLLIAGWGMWLVLMG